MTTTFTNCHLCLHGSLFPYSSISFSDSTGLFTDVSTNAADPVDDDKAEDAQVIDLQGQLLAPGFLELQTNGLRGFHFTHLDNSGEPEGYATKLDDVAKYLPRTGVTGFWATVPTVPPEEFRKVSKFMARG